MELSEWFGRSEFKCKCMACNCDSVDAELLAVLDDVREHFGKPVVINSAHRCATHNTSVGGTEHSYHLSGRAADIVVKGVDTQEVQDYLERKYPNQYGIGRYLHFTHIDTRTGKGRWNGR